MQCFFHKQFFWSLDLANTTTNLSTPCEEQRVLIEQLMKLLRKHASDEKKFGEYLTALDMAVEKKKPLSSLSNQVMEKSLLSKCAAEIRQSCAFPIRPEAAVRTSKTTFQENLVKWTSCEERQPHVVDFVLLYLRGKHGVFTVAKVWHSERKGRDHRKECYTLVTPLGFVSVEGSLDSKIKFTSVCLLFNSCWLKFQVRKGLGPSAIITLTICKGLPPKQVWLGMCTFFTHNSLGLFSHPICSL